jgi:NADH-quinone oxidoreductase subunit E
MNEKTEIKFSTEIQKELEKIIQKYPEGKQKSALLPILHLVQKESNGYLPVPVMDYVADLLKIKPIEVYEVASFYTMYNLKPVGKVVLEFCRTSPCCLNGAENIIEYTEKKLGIKNGETTSDGMFTIKCTECLGACGYAPMMQVGDYYYEHLTEEKVDSLLDEFRKNTK